MQPITIPSYTSGLITAQKPNIIPNDAFQTCDNAYIYQGQLRRRGGLELVGRLRRNFSSLVPGAATFNLFTLAGVPAGETNREIAPGSVVVTRAGPAATFTDAGNGNFTVTGAGVAAGSSVNYLTGDVTVVGGGGAISVNFGYYPGLPVMGIYQRENEENNKEDTIWFDTKYAYSYSPTDGFFTELTSTLAVTWDGGNSDFFWCSNWRGTDAGSRLFFATNFVDSTGSPIRYYGGSPETWSAAFTPAVTSTINLLQARILLPYYGRMLAINVIEGTALGDAANVNYFNRCVFSQIGSPLEADAWNRDTFGKGGFIDAPTVEQAVSARYFKNTLIVHFERSTWQLRYVGEYGIPFIWERIDSDFGAEGTFSTIQLDEGVLGVGDRAITISTSTASQRIDEKIKDLVFNIANDNKGNDRVIGQREYRQELMYWCYGDSNENRTFPNRVLVWNYFEKTWSIFRDNVTFFGIFQRQEDDVNLVTWDSLTTFWDDFLVLWDDAESQPFYPWIVSGNQQGYVHLYNAATPDEASLSVTDVTRSATSPYVVLEIVNHNLESGEIIYVTGLNFLTGSTIEPTDLNDEIYQVKFETVDTISLLKWNGTQFVDNFSFTPAVGTGTYIGGGQVTLFPRLNVETKDFMPYLDQGRMTKFVKAHLAFDRSSSGAVTVNTFSSASQLAHGNIDLEQSNVETSATTDFNPPDSDYLFHGFYALCSGQSVRLQLTWDDELMNDLETQRSNLVLSSSVLFFKPGGRTVNG